MNGVVVRGDRKWADQGGRMVMLTYQSTLNVLRGVNCQIDERDKHHRRWAGGLTLMLYVVESVHRTIVSSSAPANPNSVPASIASAS
jgi:hypothetical protein